MLSVVIACYTNETTWCWIVWLMWCGFIAWICRYTGRWPFHCSSLGKAVTARKTKTAYMLSVAVACYTNETTWCWIVGLMWCGFIAWICRHTGRWRMGTHWNAKYLSWTPRSMVSTNGCTEVPIRPSKKDNVLLPCTGPGHLWVSMHALLKPSGDVAIVFS